MRWLNYHHLLYFWTVARTGSIAAASRELFLSQPAISTQIRSLEAVLGSPLFERTGRKLVLTEAGRKAFQYADRIFRIGDELRQALAQDVRSPRLRCGLGEMTPKLLAPRLLAPLIATRAWGETLQLREGSGEALLAMLVARELDLVVVEDALDDHPDPTSEREVLGTVELGIFAPRALGEAPDLRTTPWVLPGPGTPLALRLAAWFDARELSPVIAAECQDGGSMLELGRAGMGLVVAPLSERERLQEMDGLRLVLRPELRTTLVLRNAQAFRRHPAVEWLRDALATTSEPGGADADEPRVSGAEPPDFDIALARSRRP